MVLEFNQTNANITEAVTFTLIDDNIFEDTEVFGISIELVSGQAILNPNVVYVNITDNDGKI